MQVGTKVEVLQSGQVSHLTPAVAVCRSQKQV